jgi:tetratricopeptide (TPR) repeat protein
MQSSRIVYALLALLLLAGMAVFAWTNPSYQKAFEAKWYYFMGDYDEALRLAKEAYALDRYNRMALTVMTQTEVAERYLDYIREGTEFLRQIEAIADHPPISEADKIRIKMMCEVMIDRYETLTATPLTDEELIERATNLYRKFKTLYTSLFKQK